MSTHQNTSYFDIRVHVFVDSELHDLHVIAIPMHEEHTGQAITEAAGQVLNVLCPTWKRSMISITTDGERKMTGHICGVATLFEREAGEGFFCVWCGLHQLDLCLQKFYKAVFDEDYYHILTGFIGYLRRQLNLIKEMKTRAPKVCDTRWESMSKVREKNFICPFKSCSHTFLSGF